MNITLACGCRFLRGSVFCSVFPCDAHQEGNLIRAILDELDRDITDLQKEIDMLVDALPLRDVEKPVHPRDTRCPGISAVAYRTPACDKHLSRNEEHECPWCKLAELEKAHADLHAFADDRELAVYRLEQERDALSSKLDEALKFKGD